MKLEETTTMMTSSDFKERFRAEYFQLKIRTEGLAKMLHAYKRDALSFVPNCSYELLHTQLVYMENYLNILEERAVLERIDLNE